MCSNVQATCYVYDQSDSQICSKHSRLYSTESCLLTLRKLNSENAMFHMKGREQLAQCM